MLSTIIKHHEIKDYFTRFSQFQDITPYYENGRIIIFDDLEFFEPYKDFLNKHIFHLKTEKLNIKKAKGIELVREPIGKNHILHNFTKYPIDLQACIMSTYRWLRIKVLPILFPKYEITGENWTWRLTQTNKDDMHIDSYSGQSNDLHFVRIFINLDNKPRIWRTSHQLPELYRTYSYLFKELLWGEKSHPNEINELLNKRLDWKSLPSHVIHFAPFSIWVCNSQLITHQGWYGNKLAAYTFYVDPASMQSPHLHIKQIAKEYQYMSLA